MWPFKPKEKPAAAEFQIQTHPIHLNVPSGSRKAVRRHLNRILTCIAAIEKQQGKETVNQTAVAGFKSEIHRRRMQMELAGPQVPDDKFDSMEELRRVGGV